MATFYYELFVDETGSFTGIQKDKNERYTDDKKSANVGFLVRSVAGANKGFFSDFFSTSKRHIKFDTKGNEISSFAGKIFASMCRASYTVLNPAGQIPEPDRLKLLDRDLMMGGYCFDTISKDNEQNQAYPVVIDHWGATVAKPDNALSLAARSYIQPKYLKAFVDCMDNTFADCWRVVAFRSKQRAQLEKFERHKDAEAVTALYYVDSLVDGVVQLWHKLYKQHRAKEESFYLNVFIAGKLVNGILVDKNDFLNEDKKHLMLLKQNLEDLNEDFEITKKAISDSLRMQIFGGYSPGEKKTKRDDFKKAFASMINGEKYRGSETYYKHIILTVADSFANSYLQYLNEKEYLEQDKAADREFNYTKIFEESLKKPDKLSVFKTNFNFYVLYREALKRGKKLSFVYDPAKYLLFWDNGEGYNVWKNKYDAQLERNFAEIIKPLENDSFRNDFISKTVLYLKNVLPVNKNEKYLHILESLNRVYVKMTEHCEQAKGYVPKAVAVFGLDLALFKVYLCQNLGKITEADRILEVIKTDVIRLANSETYVDRQTIYTELKMNGMSDRFRNDLVEREYYELEERLKNAKRLKDLYVAVLTGQSLPRKKSTAVFTKDLGKIHNMFIESQITRVIQKHFNKKTIQDSFEKELGNYNNYKKIYMASLKCFPDFPDRDFTYSGFLRLVTMYDKKHTVAEQVLLASVSRELTVLAEPGKGNWSIKDFFNKRENQHLNFKKLVKDGLYNQSNGTVRWFVLLNYLTVLRKLAISKNTVEYNYLLEGLKNANVVLDDNKMQRQKNHYPLCLVYWRLAEIILGIEGNTDFNRILSSIHIIGGNNVFDDEIEAGIDLVNKSIVHLEQMGSDEVSSLRITAIKMAVLSEKIHYMYSQRGKDFYDKRVLDAAIADLKHLYVNFKEHAVSNIVGNDDAVLNLFAPVMERCKDGTDYNNDKIIKFSKYLAQCVPDYF